MNIEEKLMGYDLSEEKIFYANKKIFYVKLKDNVYIIEGCSDKQRMEPTKEGTFKHVGLRCDGYNITEEKYYPCTKSFPDSLSCIDMVVTDKKETFAIILGTKADITNYTSLTSEKFFKTNLFVFTEQTGLKLLASEADNALSQDLSNKQKFRFEYLCRRWPNVADVQCRNYVVSVTDSLLLRIK